MAEKVVRKWGTYEVIAEGASWKLKRLIVNPHSQSSYQRHFKRSEVWFYPQDKHIVFIGQKEWHYLVNEGVLPLEIIELQVGNICSEDDIERK